MSKFSETLRVQVQELINDCNTGNLSLSELVHRFIECADRLHAGDEKPAAEENNGVTRPRSGATARIWQIADNITALNKKDGNPPASRENVVAVAKLESIKEATAGAAYSNWAKFNGVNPKDASKPFEPKKPKEKKEEAVLPPPPPLLETPQESFDFPPPPPPPPL